MKKIAPSILSADGSRLGAEIAAVEAAGADMIHIDVMDGHFVPNLTLGPGLIASLRKATRLPFDVHLMIENPERYIEAFAKAGSDRITVHAEASAHLHRIIAMIREHGVRPGVSLNPATPLILVEPILPDIDLLLIMTVNPGFGGQKFIGGMLSKIALAKEMINAVAPEVLLEVDGGVTLKNIRSIADAGADILVAGASVFDSNNYAETISAMHTLLSGASPSLPENHRDLSPADLFFCLIKKKDKGGMHAAGHSFDTGRDRLEAGGPGIRQTGGVVRPDPADGPGRDHLPAGVRQGPRRPQSPRPALPKKYGGRGLSWSAEIAALEEVGVLGTALGCAFSMPSIVGQALHSFGTEEQKEKFLKPLLKGELISAEALTEPRGGSDFFGATTQAELKGDHFVVEGQKRFVVAADGADFFIVYCNTDPAGKPHERISLILIEKDRPGVEVKYLYKLLGTRGGGTGRLIFRDVKVPAANLIGGLNEGALIFNTMMVPERLTSAGGSLGMARAALEVAARYSDRRKAFGQKIRNFEGVSFKVADAITALDAARALTIAAGKTVERGFPPPPAGERGKEIRHGHRLDGLQPRHAGHRRHRLHKRLSDRKMIRDTRLTQIWTGTNEIMNLLIQHEYYTKS